MIIESFTIKNFKSIENLTLYLEPYGKGKGKSSLTFLVGTNESGKSAILEAIHLWFSELDSIDYGDSYHKGASEGGYIWIEAKMKFEDGDHDYILERISEAIEIDEADINKVRIKELKNITYKNSTKAGNFYTITISPDFPFYKYVFTKEAGIKSLSSLNGVTETITTRNAQTFLKTGQVLLTQKELEEQIRLKISSEFHAFLPTVDMWKPLPEYLINDSIDLTAFKVKPTISIPLRNIFWICGFDTDEKIKSKVDQALLKPENKAELQRTLTKGITNYVNRIWKEHKINIVVNIDATKCSVHVEDKDKEYKYYSMKQRSNGFNQFISLILSLSTTSENNELRDSIILLDEPEIHLHPSGVRYMRDELLKIGRNNMLIVSTHSHYMVDASTPERHFIVSKKQMRTEINQIGETTSMNDDQVLSGAFGINLFKELLPSNILVVEGGDDKSIFSHGLNLIFDDFFYSMKSAGGASKMYGIASIMTSESIPAYFITDDDKEGRDVKKEILSKLGDSIDRSKVMTLRDLLPELIDKGTVEDLLPIEFVKSFFETEMGQEFNFDRTLPLIIQIKNQNEALRDNKEQLNSKKVKLAEGFIEKHNTKRLLENGAPKLVKLLEALVNKVRQ